MSEILRWMIYLYTGLAAAAFAYGVIQMFFLTRYADYQERMLRSFGERGGGLALVIDPQKLQHLSILLCSGLFLFGVLLGAGNLFVGMFLGGILVIPGLLMPRIVFSDRIGTAGQFDARGLDARGCPGTQSGADASGSPGGTERCPA